MELKQVDIFAGVNDKPNVVITYLLGRRKAIKEFKVWLSNDYKDSWTTMNNANLLRYSLINIKNKKGQLKENKIFINDKLLLADKLWKNYKVKKVKVHNEVAIEIAPYPKYIEFDNDYLENKVMEEIEKSMRESVVAKNV